MAPDFILLLIFLFMHLFIFIDLLQSLFLSIYVYNGKFVITKTFEMMNRIESNLNTGCVLQIPCSNMQSSLANIIRHFVWKWQPFKNFDRHYQKEKKHLWTSLAENSVRNLYLCLVRCSISSTVLFQNEYSIYMQISGHFFNLHNLNSLLITINELI